jgi:pimeloyl-ACP methyl ester carboxylesterase
MEALINTHRIYFEVQGPEDGPGVVFLHHGLGSTRAWKAQVKALVHLGYRVLNYDRWGYGQSESRPNLDAPYFVSDILDLEVLLDQQGFNQVALIGHSDGGTISLLYTLKHPEQVRCLVLVAAHVYIEPVMLPGFFALQQRFTHDIPFREALARAHGEDLDSSWNNWISAWMKPASLDWNICPQLAKISCPTLVIQGELDEHASPQHAIDITKGINGADNWLAPGQNHMFPQENPQLFNPRFIEFLEKAFHVQ